MLRLWCAVFAGHYDALPDRNLKQNVGDVVIDDIGVKFHLAVIVGIQQQIGLLLPYPRQQRQHEIINLAGKIHRQYLNGVVVHERRFTSRLDLDVTFIHPDRDLFRVGFAPGVTGGQRNGLY